MISRISSGELNELAGRWGFSVDAADAEAYRDLLERVFSVVDDVEPSAAAPPPRDAGRPAAGGRGPAQRRRALVPGAGEAGGPAGGHAASR